MNFEVEEKKIISAMGKAGVVVEDVFDLVNTREPYPEAIPVLINLLEEGINHRRLKDGIIRALGVKEAKGVAGSVLLKEFKRLPEEMQSLGWVIGNAFRVVLTKDELDEVIEIAKNSKYGSNRQNFLTAMAKFKDDRVENLLIELLNDDDVRVHAIEALGIMKSKKAKPLLEGLVEHSDSLVRKESAKALKKIK